MTKTKGQEAYERYSNTPEIDGKAFNGDPLKEWDQLGSRIQAGWESAANTGLSDFKLKELYTLCQKNYRYRQNDAYQPLELDWCGIQFTANARSTKYTNEQQFISFVWNHLTTAYLQSKYQEFSNDFSLNG